MSRFSLVSLAALYALPAMAQETTESVADVNFEAEQVLFRGPDQVLRFPENFALAFELAANVSADAEGIMAAQSNMVWPEAMRQSWVGVPGGGEMTADVSLALDAYVILDGSFSVSGFEIDFSGDPSCSASLCLQPLSYSIWDDETTWTSTTFFDSLLLPGASLSSVSIVLNEANNSVFEWSPGSGLEIPIGDYIIELSGQFSLSPDSAITISGQNVTTRGRVVDSFDGEVLVPVPSVNDGTATFESVWNGEVTSSFSVVPVIAPIIDIENSDGSNLTVGGGLDVGSTLAGLLGNALTSWAQGFARWDIATDTRPFRSKNTEYTHDLPAIDTDESSLDFGSILIDTESQLNLTIEDLGAIELWGDIVVEGDGFSISRPDLEVDPEDEMSLTVTFRPGETGNFDGTLTLESNDPVNPTVAIPLSGNGFDETGDTGETPDTGDGGGGEAGIRGCGCSSTPGGSLAWLALIPAFGFVLRRRR